MDALSGVTIVCWLMGTIPVPELHEGRLRMLWEKLVDTPVRGVVYEGALPEGEAVARTAAETWQIPLEVLAADPADHDAWLAAARGRRPPARALTPTSCRCNKGVRPLSSVAHQVTSRASRSWRIRPVAPQMRWPPTS